MSVPTRRPLPLILIRGFGNFKTDDEQRLTYRRLYLMPPLNQSPIRVEYPLFKKAEGTGEAGGYKSGS